jgi:branched-chain amino acid transport system substrate-binding protein
MNMTANLWIPTLALAVMMGLTGCKPADQPGGSSSNAGGAGGGDDANIIRVGEYASLTGKEAAFGNSSHNGTMLGIEEVNARGGVLGKKLKLIYEDDQSKGGESATIAKKLISGDKVVALLGEVASGRSLEAAPICQQNKIPMIAPSSTNPKVTQAGDYIFRVCFTDDFQGRLIANFALKSLKVKKIAMMNDVGLPYSVGLGNFFRDAFTAAGGTILLEKDYTSGEKDFKAQLTAIKGVNPEAIFIPGYYTEAGLIAQQARQLGITVPLFGGDGWEAPELIQLGGDAMEGNFFSTHYSAESDSPAVVEFVKKYKARFKGETPDAMAALGYDTVMVLADSIKRAGTTDGPKLRDAIAATKDFDSVTGKTTLDANRNATKPAVIITIKNGKFKYVETIQP